MAWAPDYLTAAQAKGWLRIDDVVDDVEIATAITAASRAVDTATGRQFGQVAVAETRTYRAWWNRQFCRWQVDVDDLQDLTGFQLFVGSTEITSAYAFEPSNALAKGLAYTRIVLDTGAEAFPSAAAPEVYPFGLWGWDAVPDTVLQATKLQTARFLGRRDAVFGIAGSPDQGSELRLLSRVDPDVDLMLTRYRRKWGAR